MMTIVRGTHLLEPASARELTVLEKNGAGADQRLGCQCPMPPDGSDLLITTGYW